jgi:serine protease Do
MCRGALPLLLPLLLVSPARPSDTEPDRAALLKQAQVLQDLVKAAIREAGPAVACILVSRSDAYQRYGQGPSPDNPGQLGGLDADALARQLASLALSPAERDRLRRRLDLADPAHVPEAFGSGVVVDETGLVLTPYHVVQDATKIYVRLPDGPGCYADIHAADPRSDLAILRLLGRPHKYRFLALGDGSKAEPGQFVVALNNPFTSRRGASQAGAALGLIRKVCRHPAAARGKDGHAQPLHEQGVLLEIDARLSAVCSGGALLNLKGELIGLTSALAAVQASEAPVSFAVPLDAGLRQAVDILKRGEEVEYGFLGVTFDRNAAAGGVVLGHITAGSPADRAGLRPRDVILAVNGVAVHGSNDLVLALRSLLAGSRVALEVRKHGARESVRLEVPLAKYYVAGKVLASSLAPRPFFRGLRVDYTSILVQKQPHALGFQRIPFGVLVSEVRGDSSAATALLRPGDIITHVNGRPVDTPPAFYQEVAGQKGPVELTLAGARPGQPAPKVVLN